ncbi:hypothetical protein TNCV_3330631 [Trichonephila clavipes]|nr:hypothetical protein TNCV_3330631 [Trichonephila clavipes]
METPPISTSSILPWDWRGGKYSPVPCTHDSAHKTFGPTDLMSTYSVCTRRVFGGIGHRTRAFRQRVVVGFLLERDGCDLNADDSPKIPQEKDFVKIRHNSKVTGDRPHNSETQSNGIRIGTHE